MAKIVDLQTYRTQQFIDRVFGPWRKRFDEAYNENTHLYDLTDKALLHLAQPGDASTLAYYELIMGALDLGDAADFYILDKGDQLKIVEAHLFLADQVRFEVMRRLQWVAGFNCQSCTLLDLLQDTDSLKIQSRECPPELSVSYPGFPAFQELTTRDKEAFVRRLLPEAIEAFRKTIR